MNICVTGSSGFIGQSLIKKLTKYNYKIVCPVRNLNFAKFNYKNLKFIKINDLQNENIFFDNSNNINCLIHLAAKTNYKKNSLTEFKKANVELTRSIANQAVASGVKRLIFLSTIKVNGNNTDKNDFFYYNDEPKPYDPYSISKYECEKVLKEISKKKGLEVVIIRPPLVYGEGVKGNFLNLINIIDKNIPLPFKNINNARSYVSVDNLTDLIIKCIHHKNASNKTFLVSDNEDISTPELISKLSKLMNKSSKLFFFPKILLKLIGHLLNKNEKINSLLSSQKISINYTCETLDWYPPYKLNDTLVKTISWFKKKMIRFFDIIFSLIGLILSSPLLLVVFILCLIDTGSPIFLQKRIGFRKKYFTLVKFRTMNKNTLSSTSTHLISNKNITSLGKILRYYKIDEMPQLWNVLIGDMSIVGPRPCLLNQKKIIRLRSSSNIFSKKPGITGLAQIKDVTMRYPELLVKLDKKMIKNNKLSQYFYLILLTIFKIFKNKILKEI